MATNYMHRRNAVYHGRMGVPERLRGIIGKREITRSLGTKDYDEAKRLVVSFVAEAFAIAAGVRSGANDPQESERRRLFRRRSSAL